jgi:hypothetical protein
MLGGTTVLAILKRSFRTVVAIGELNRFWLLLVTFRRGSLGLLLLSVSYDSMRKTICSVDGFLSIQRARIAIRAGMGEVLTYGLFPVVGVKAFDVLPRVARLAVDRVSIIVSEGANTLDCVRFFLTPFCLRRRLILDEWLWDSVGERLTRSRSERRQGRRFVGHNLSVSLRIDGPGGTGGGGNVEG